MSSSWTTGARKTRVTGSPLSAGNFRPEEVMPVLVIEDRCDVHGAFYNPVEQSLQPSTSAALPFDPLSVLTCCEL